MPVGKRVIGKVLCGCIGAKHYCKNMCQKCYGAYRYKLVSQRPGYQEQRAHINKRRYDKIRDILVQKANDYYWNNKRVRDYKNRRGTWKRYGIDPDEAEKMLLTSDGYCQICKREYTLRGGVIDHNHKTGKVRGVLCDRCNVGLGMFLDDHKLLELAVEYLKRTDGV